jgi:aspartyl-tRNA(Asn)/glutamyl-tRNA(Gln) amidotransferase subunit A
MSIPSIAEAAALIAARKLSPVELTAACLARLHATEATLHAFVLPTEERALADARAAETAIMKDGPRGPMHGIPIGLKDIVDTAGIETTCGSKILAGNVPEKDAACATKLAAAGTVLMGKLTTHEFADGGPSFDLPKPPARNPWNPDHFTAGSSSGTGAAVAAGVILCGIGTDTGGSIRGPAALCGIAGLKPTYGLVSRAGVAPAAFSLDHIGPMAWTAEDCAIMLQVLAGHDPADPASASQPVPDYRAALNGNLKGVRVGVIRHFHEDDYKVEPAVQDGIDHALSVFRSLGASISDVKLSSLQDWHACGSLISITERAAAYEEWSRTRLGDFSERVQRRLHLGALVSGVDYVQAVRRRRELQAELQAAMASLDVVITAGAPGEAPRMDAIPRWDLFDKPNFTMPFNVAGYPAMCVCSGFGPGGLPVSVRKSNRLAVQAAVVGCIKGADA